MAKFRDGLNKLEKKSAKTLKKEQAREIARQIALLEKQIAKAIGVSHFFLRDPVTNKWRRVTDPDEIESAIDAGLECHKIYTKDPDVQACIDLMNFALGEPD